MKTLATSDLQCRSRIPTLADQRGAALADQRIIRRLGGNHNLPSRSLASGSLFDVRLLPDATDRWSPGNCELRRIICAASFKTLSVLPSGWTTSRLCSPIRPIPRMTQSSILRSRRVLASSHPAIATFCNFEIKARRRAQHFYCGLISSIF